MVTHGSDPTNMEEAVGEPAAVLCQFLDSTDQLLASCMSQACHILPISCFFFMRRVPLKVLNQAQTNGAHLVFYALGIESMFLVTHFILER